MTTTRKSNFSAGLRTTILMATLGGLLVAIGYAIGGIADRVRLPRDRPGDELRRLLVQRQDRAARRRGAKPISEQEAPRHLPDGPRADHARRPADAAPVHDPAASSRTRSRPAAARSTRRSRSPSGITKLLSEDELRGVIAHELAHIRNRDILTQSVASAIGAMITYLAYMLHVVRRRRRVAARPDRQPGDGPARADRGDA